MLIVFFWLIGSLSNKLLGQNKAFSKFSNISYTLMFNLFYFDLQMVAATELSIHDISIDQPFYLKLSFVLSFVILNIIIYEIISAVILVRKIGKLKKLKVK